MLILPAMLSAGLTLVSLLLSQVFANKSCPSMTPNPTALIHPDGAQGRSVTVTGTRAGQIDQYLGIPFAVPRKSISLSSHTPHATFV